MKKMIALILAAAAVCCLLSACGEKYIGKDKALEIAVSDAEIGDGKIYDKDVELEKEKGSAWYSVEFKSGGREYEYDIDAVDGTVLASQYEKD